MAQGEEPRSRGGQRNSGPGQGSLGTWQPLWFWTFATGGGKKLFPWSDQTRRPLLPGPGAERRRQTGVSTAVSAVGAEPTRSAAGRWPRCPRLQQRRGAGTTAKVHLRQVPSCNSASSGGQDVAWQSRPEQGDRDAACEAGSRAATVALQEPGERSPDLVPWGGGHHVLVPRSPGPQRHGAGGTLTLLAWIRWKFFPCTRKPCSKFLHSSSLQAQSPSATGGQRRQQQPGRGGCRGWSGRAGTHLG